MPSTLQRGFSYLQPTLKYLTPPYWPSLWPTITLPIPFSALRTTDRIAHASNFYFSLFCKFFFHQFFCLSTSIVSDPTDILLLLSELQQAALAGGLDPTIFQAPFQPLQFCDNKKWPLSKFFFPSTYFFSLNSLSLSQTYTQKFNPFLIWSWHLHIRSHLISLIPPQLSQYSNPNEVRTELLILLILKTCSAFSVTVDNILLSFTENF